MDKKKQKTAPSVEKDKHKNTEDKKKMRKNKEADAEASTKISKCESQQQSRQDEVTVMKSDLSDGNGRIQKIGFEAKRTKKPPKSLENFICRPTARISQRLSHREGQSSCGGAGSGSDITRAVQSHHENQKTDISSKASTTSLPTSTKKVDSAPMSPPSKKVICFLSFFSHVN